MTPIGPDVPKPISLGVAVPAAGSGSRMGGVRKPLLELAGRPVLLHAIQPFLEHDAVVALAIALSPEDHDDPPLWLRDLDLRITLVEGGATRGESVWAALQALPEGVEAVAVHDAARPLVTGAIIDRCLAEVREGRGAVAGWPAVDTLKEVDQDHRIIGTPQRDRLWHAQTPQIFPRAMIADAYRKAISEGLTDTDDAALVERVGGAVVMVPGSAANLKVTRPEDLAVAELLLGRAEV